MDLAVRCTQIQARPLVWKHYGKIHTKKNRIIFGHITIVFLKSSILWGKLCFTSVLSRHNAGKSVYRRVTHPWTLAYKAKGPWAPPPRTMLVRSQASQPWVEEMFVKPQWAFISEMKTGANPSFRLLRESVLVKCVSNKNNTKQK